jgi:hypothetical protein
VLPCFELGEEVELTVEFFQKGGGASRLLALQKLGNRQGDGKHEVARVFWVKTMWFWERKIRKKSEKFAFVRGVFSWKNKPGRR